MAYLHILAAILATWRLTDLMTQDRITQPIRDRLKTYLWSCPRCMSVWMGGLCTALFALGPITHDWSRWSLWPFALAWLYLVQIDWTVTRRMAEKGRELKITLQPNGQFQFNSELNQQEAVGAMQMVLQQLTRSSAPSQPVNGGVRT